MSRRRLVVGAGSAGCVVAARLGASVDDDVVVLEAGPDHLDPVGTDWLDAIRDPDRIHTGLVAVRAPGAAPATYVRGRGVGGSGAINAMLAPPGGPIVAPHRLTLTVPGEHDHGAVGRALLAASPDAAPVPLTWADGRRSSVVDAYLRPAIRAGQVELRADAPVRRVVLDDRHAVGVELVDGTFVEADQVVLCAGAVHSPAILLRSGCDVAGIGEGLHDHPAAAITLDLAPDARSDPSRHPATVLADRHGVHVVALEHLGHAAPHLGLLLTGLMTPRSRGRLTLDPADPDGEPIVELRSLTDPDDLARMVDAVASTIRLLDHPAFASIVEQAYVDDLGTTVDALTSPAAIAEWLPTHLGDYFHASSTCAMGRVVDDRCAVVGHEGLFVCDASVFERVPEVNTHLPTVMLAEAMSTHLARLR